MIADFRILVIHLGYQTTLESTAAEDGPVVLVEVRGRGGDSFVISHTAVTLRPQPTRTGNKDGADMNYNSCTPRRSPPCWSELDQSHLIMNPLAHVWGLLDGIHSDLY